MTWRAPTTRPPRCGRGRLAGARGREGSTSACAERARRASYTALMYECLRSQGHFMSSSAVWAPAGKRVLYLVVGKLATLLGRDSSPSARNDSSWRWFRLARGYRLRVPVLHEMALPPLRGPLRRDGPTARIRVADEGRLLVCAKGLKTISIRVFALESMPYAGPDEDAGELHETGVVLGLHVTAYLNGSELR